MYIHQDKFLGVNLKLQFTIVTVISQNCCLLIQLVDFNGRIYTMKRMASIFNAAPDISS